MDLMIERLLPVWPLIMMMLLSRRGREGFEGKDGRVEAAMLEFDEGVELAGKWGASERGNLF